MSENFRLNDHAGRIDAHAAVVAARDYRTPLSVALGRSNGPLVTVNAPIPQLTPLESTVEISLNGTCEHVQVVVDINHPEATELAVRLTSPSGTTSVLAKLRGFSLAMRINNGATSYSATVAAFSRCAECSLLFLRVWAHVRCGSRLFVSVSATWHLRATCLSCLCRA